MVGGTGLGCEDKRLKILTKKGRMACVARLGSWEGPVAME